MKEDDNGNIPHELCPHGELLQVTVNNRVKFQQTEGHFFFFFVSSRFGHGLEANELQFKFDLVRASGLSSIAAVTC